MLSSLLGSQPVLSGAIGHYYDHRWQQTDTQLWGGWGGEGQRLYTNMPTFSDQPVLTYNVPCLSPKPERHLTSCFLFLPQLHLPLNSPLPGSELTKEPFRWDQRLFALVLRLPGMAVPDSEQLGSVPTDESAITQMCEVTGGTASQLHFKMQVEIFIK